MDPTSTRFCGLLALMFSLMLVSLVVKYLPDVGGSGLSAPAHAGQAATRLAAPAVAGRF
ncbi:hypothetical protein [Prosthecomicrobium sp. N25]|uniref:hypothetical protein n=1 Tax=Prosthecomicrobium sp. N25 TaxID=3129254 RepID=UPI0030774D57